MNDTSEAAVVNLAALTIFALLRLSVPSRDVFWVAMLHGAATPNGWHGPSAVQSVEYETTRGAKWSARRFRDAANELERAGLMDVERDIEARPSVLRLACAHAVCSANALPTYEHVDSRLMNLAVGVDSRDSREVGAVSAKDLNGSAVFNAGKEERKNIKSFLGGECEGNSSLCDVRKRNEQSSFNAFAPTVPPFPSSTMPPGGYRNLTRRLVAFWADRSGREKVRPLDRRVQMVMSRLREGYEPDNLFRAIAGVCHSPFHREGGYDTFEVALRNGEQVEKGMHLWQLHAPIEHIIRYEERTGETVKARAEDVREVKRQHEEDEDTARRVSALLAERAVEAEAEAEQARLDAETTELVQVGLDELDAAAAARRGNVGQ